MKSHSILLWIRGVLCLAAWLLADRALRVAAGEEQRPNIVVLLADDLRWDAMSCAGNAVLKTPNIDQLASRGTRFRNAFLTTSICCVSRASILTGQYARRHGVNDFRTPLRDLSATYPMILQQHGYYSGFIGKWGINADNRDSCVECAGRFDFWAGDMFQTAYWHERNCNFIKNDGTSNRTRFFCSCPPAGRRGDGVMKGGPNPALRDPVHAETEFVPAKIVSFLDQQTVGKPFCLSISFKAPHGPWGGFAPKFAKDFERIDFPRRPNVTLDEALRQPEFLKVSLASDTGMRMVKDLSLDGERNRLLRQYYRLIEGLDECVGSLLRELRARQLADNTIIVFTSDNGHFSGEHGFFGKWLMHEESLRTPMIVCDLRPAAKGQGQTCDEMVLNIDVAPTILQFAGLPVPDGMQGQSMIPLLHDTSRSFRDHFFYEHLYGHGAEPPMHIERSEGVRTRDWKYIVYVDQTGPDREELYDLRDDPFEMKNLATASEHQSRLAELRRQRETYGRELK